MIKLTNYISSSKTALLIFLLFVAFYSCKTNNDPLKDSELGIIKRSEFQAKLLKQKVISEPDNDSVHFRYNISNKKKKFPVEISFNPGWYKLGKLRHININLNGDSIYWDRSLYARAGGPRLKEKVDEIYDIYNQWYGIPDSISIEYPKLLGSDPINILFGTKEDLNRVDSTKTPQKTAFWYKENFTLSFYRPFPEKDSRLDSALVYNYAYINYKMIDYDNELQRIKDSIRKELTPKDIINIRACNPEWITLKKQSYSDYDSKFEVELDKIMRKDFEEDRGVSSIRFDIVISDNFNKELYRIKDVTYEPNEPLMNGSSGLIKYGTPIISYTKYHKNSNDAIGLENARIYANQSKIKVNTDIKAIVFTDGIVLESN